MIPGNFLQDNSFMDHRKCQHLNGSYVKETRHSNGAIWRRRQCKDCGAMFSTYEIQQSEYNYLMTTEKKWKKLSALL